MQIFRFFCLFLRDGRGARRWFLCRGGGCQHKRQGRLSQDSARTEFHQRTLLRLEHYVVPGSAGRSAGAPAPQRGRRPDCQAVIISGNDERGEQEREKRAPARRMGLFCVLNRDQGRVRPGDLDLVPDLDLRECRLVLDAAEHPNGHTLATEPTDKAEHLQWYINSMLRAVEKNKSKESE